mgnify:CR=1 FL=1
MKKQYIIPIFVPHLGCPNDCIFCNQKSISGQKSNMTKEKAKEIIENYLKSIDKENAQIEIAFFGGSFTAIEEERQEELLQVASEFVKSGQVESIRVSTRPDAIDKKILKRLKKYKVKTIELGVQSSNNYILKRINRGHTFEDVKRAAKLIRWNGFRLGVQMMVGLPESTTIDEINTAKELIKLKPKMVRIYPVLVIKNTPLEKELEKGTYKPLTVVQAVEVCKEIVRLFHDKNIDIIRIGLQPTDEISEPGSEKSEVVAGPYHPAFRQLVESSMWYDTIVSDIKKINTENYIERLKNAKQVEKLLFPDQDILNKIFSEKVKLISQSWNYCCGTLIWHPSYLNEITGEFKKDFISAHNAPKIIHYTSPKKPWNSVDEEFFDIFWKYARETDVYEELMYLMCKATAQSTLVEEMRYINLFTKTETEKKIVFWGASLFLESFLKKYAISNDNILGIIDKNPSRKGRFINQYQIFAPEDLKTLNPDEIIITIVNSAEKRAAEIKDFLVMENQNHIKVKTI